MGNNGVVETQQVDIWGVRICHEARSKWFLFSGLLGKVSGDLVFSTEISVTHICTGSLQFDL